MQIRLPYFKNGETVFLHYGDKACKVKILGFTLQDCECYYQTSCDNLEEGLELVGVCEEYLSRNIDDPCKSYDEKTVMDQVEYYKNN